MRLLDDPDDLQLFRCGISAAGSGTIILAPFEVSDMQDASG
jgi:hypothetical protein